MEILQQIRWDILFPIITFILGLSYSLIDKYMERKREKENLKTVLFYEIARNHYMLYKLPDWGKDIKSMIRWAAAAQSLEYSIYEEYLGKINVLMPDELNAVLSAYSSIEFTIKRGNDYMEYLGKNVEDEDFDNELHEAHAKSLQYSIEQTQRLLSVAVEVFAEGREDLLKKLQSLYPDSPS